MLDWNFFQLWEVESAMETCPVDIWYQASVIMNVIQLIFGSILLGLLR